MTEAKAMERAKTICPQCDWASRLDFVPLVKDKIRRGLPCLCEEIAREILRAVAEEREGHHRNWPDCPRCVAVANDDFSAQEHEALAVEAEREACAKVADQGRHYTEIATRIRNRA